MPPMLSRVILFRHLTQVLTIHCHWWWLPFAKTHLHSPPYSLAEETSKDTDTQTLLKPPTKVSLKKLAMHSFGSIDTTSTILTMSLSTTTALWSQPSFALRCWKHYTQPIKVFPWWELPHDPLFLGQWWLYDDITSTGARYRECISNAPFQPSSPPTLSQSTSQRYLQTPRQGPFLWIWCNFTSRIIPIRIILPSELLWPIRGFWGNIQRWRPRIVAAATETFLACWDVSHRLSSAYTIHNQNGSTEVASIKHRTVGVPRHWQVSSGDNAAE